MCISMVYVIEHLLNYQMLLNAKRVKVKYNPANLKTHTHTHTKVQEKPGSPNMLLCAPIWSHQAGTVRAKEKNTMEWWRDSFARAAFPATQLAAEHWAHQISKWPSTGMPTWSVAWNGAGQIGPWLHWSVSLVIVLTGSQQMGEKYGQVQRRTVIDGVIIMKYQY